MLGVGIGLGVGEFIGTRPGLAPKLDLNFASTKSLTASKGPTPSFSRASTGTYFNSSGVLTSAAINAPRFDHTFNGTSWVSKGLLVEDQRTNIALRSEDFTNAYWTKSAGVTLTAGDRVAPDGAQSGTKVVFTAANQEVYKSFSGITGTPYTISLWVYGTAGETITLFDGNAAVLTTLTGTWQRIVTTSSNVAYFDFGTFGGSTARTVWIWGAQLEAGAFPTSYIPTTSASTTRSADVCQITGGDFSGFWNGAEGSIAVEFDRNGTPSPSLYTPFIYSASGSPANANWISLRQDGTTGTNQFYVVNSGSTQAQINSGSFPGSNISCKNSSAYKLNDFASSDNGALPITDTSGTAPSASTLDIGYLSGFAGPPYALNGHIARLRYFNKRLPNATLQQLST